MKLDYLQNHFYLENPSNVTSSNLYSSILLGIIAYEINAYFFTKRLYMQNNGIVIEVSSRYEHIGVNIATYRTRF